MLAASRNVSDFPLGTAVDTRRRYASIFPCGWTSGRMSSFAFNPSIFKYNYTGVPLNFYWLNFYELAMFELVTLSHLCYAEWRSALVGQS